MKIPIRFELGGRGYEVIEDNNMTKQDTRGLCIHTTGQIFLPERNDNCDRQFINQTFFHEFTHAILYQIGEHELNDNEEFVSRFGNALYHAFKSAHY